MSDTKSAPTLDKATRLAAIRAANVQKQVNVTSTASAGAGAAADSRGEAAAVRRTSGAAVAVSADPAQALASPIEIFGLLFLVAVLGAVLVTFALPSGLMTGMSASLLGPEPKAYWYLARSTAFVAYGLLWLSMTLGLMMTNKMARLWPGGPAAFALHEHASILGLAFGLFHALILLGDRYSNYTLAQILVPFAIPGTTTLWVGLGQVSLYLMGIVGLSFFVRSIIGRSVWRIIHVLSFIIFGLVLCHGVLSGSDSGTIWAQAIYWVSGGSLLFLLIDRALSSVLTSRRVARPLPAAGVSADSIS